MKECPLYVWMPPYVWTLPYMFGCLPYVLIMFGCPLYIHNTKKACFVRVRGIHMPQYIWMLPYVWMPPVCLDGPTCLNTPTCLDASCMFWISPICLDTPICWSPPYVWMMFGCLLYICNSKKA